MPWAAQTGTTDEGMQIVLGDSSIHVTDTAVVINADTVTLISDVLDIDSDGAELTGDLTITGDLSVSGTTDTVDLSVTNEPWES